MTAKEDLEISAFLTNLLDKYFGSVAGPYGATLEYFLFGATRHVVSSLKRILKPEQYEDLAKTIELKNLTHIVPIKNPELTFQQYLATKYSIKDIFKIKKLDLMPKDYLSFYKCSS